LAQREVCTQVEKKPLQWPNEFVSDQFDRKLLAQRLHATAIGPSTLLDRVAAMASLPRAASL